MQFILNKKRVIMLLAKDSVKSDTRVISEAGSLLRNGYDVSVVAWDREGISKKKEEYERIKIERLRLRTSFSNSSKLMFYLILFNMAAFFRLLSENFDIIHCHDFDTLVAGLFAGKLKCKKVVYDAHEIYSLMVQTYVPKIVVKAISVVEFLLIKKVDVLITVSEILADYFKKSVRGKVKISVVMNCKDPSAFQTSEKEIKELKAKFEMQNHFLILYDGWLIPDNGLEELFSSIENLDGKIRDVIAVICGDGCAEQEFRKMVEEKNIEKYVKFIGKIQSKDIPLFVNACDIMYIMRNPIIKYNFLSTPNRLFEAIVAGKPVIASNFGNIRRIVEKGGFGLLVSPGDINELCDAILMLSHDKKVTKRLSEKAKDMSKKYNWPLMEKRLLSLYEYLTLGTND